MIKIVFLDFDGTAYSHQTEGIPASTIQAVRELKEKGILIFLCTGRAAPEMKDFDVRELQLDGMILSNGLMITDKNNEIIYDLPTRGELKERLIRIYNEKKIPIYFATKDELFLNFENETIRIVQEAVSSPIPPVKEYAGETFYMASAFIDSEESYREMMDLRSLAEVTYWHEGAVDIVPRGMSKIKGIDLILKQHGLSIEESMAFGDGENDIGMLRHCGIGVAMGNSPQEIKDAADYVTDDIDDDGIYHALKHFHVL